MPNLPLLRKPMKVAHRIFEKNVLQKISSDLATLIGSERPQFFFEINESWYYILNLPTLHWGKKPEE